MRLFNEKQPFPYIKTIFSKMQLLKKILNSLFPNFHSMRIDHPLNGSPSPFEVKSMKSGKIGKENELRTFPFSPMYFPLTCFCRNFYFDGG